MMRIKRILSKSIFLSALLIFFSIVSIFCQETPKEDYAVGVGDILEIVVLQPEKILATVAVAPDEGITFPYIGSIKVGGWTIARIQREIQHRLSQGYMKYPVVSVSLKESHSRKFSVYGQVTKPGTYPLEDNLTVIKAISMAGGFTSPGSSGRVKVLRPKGDSPEYEKIETDINSIMNGAEGQENIIVKAGDTLVVSEDRFFIYGEVRQPGSFPLEFNTTVLKAISIAGGFTQPGSSGRAKVLRLNEKGPGYNTIDADISFITGAGGSSKDADIIINPGDSIVVYADKLFVYGEVMRPGSYPLENNTTVLRAISMAGGFTSFGSSSRVKVLKPRKDKPGYETIKVNITAVMDGTAKEDALLEPGDIVMVTEEVF
ncbi:MAG: SLBB domain-containing protein [Candidatus Omnitrophota bacterium]